MRCVVLSSDKTIWALRITQYLMARFFPGAQVVVGGYTPPAFRLLPGWEFERIGAFENYPVERWSDGVIRFLSGLRDELVIVMLDDYWLLRAVDVRAVAAIELYMLDNRDVARFDLTLDRANNAAAKPAGYLEHLDLVESTPDIPYHFSFQAAVWRREMLLSLLSMNESPWEAEIRCNGRLINAGWSVLGTRQGPMRYLIGVQQGNLALDGGYQTQAYAMPEKLIGALRDLGYLP